MPRTEKNMNIFHRGCRGLRGKPIQSERSIPNARMGTSNARNAQILRRATFCQQTMVGVRLRDKPPRLERRRPAKCATSLVDLRTAKRMIFAQRNWRANPFDRLSNAGANHLRKSSRYIRAVIFKIPQHFRHVIPTTASPRFQADERQRLNRFSGAAAARASVQWRLASEHGELPEASRFKQKLSPPGWPPGGILSCIFWRWTSLRLQSLQVIRTVASAVRELLESHVTSAWSSIPGVSRRPESQHGACTVPQANPRTLQSDCVHFSSQRLWNTSRLEAIGSSVYVRSGHVRERGKRRGVRSHR